MNDRIFGVPEAIGAVLVASALTLAGWAFRRMWRGLLDRAARRLNEVELLRIALDKGRMRENAHASAGELLTLAVKILVDGEEKAPPAAVMEAVARAEEIVRSAIARCAEAERLRREAL